MTSERSRLLNVRRGLRGAAVAAVIVAVLVVVLPLGFLATGHDIPGFTRRDLGYDLREEPEQLAGPVVGCAIFCACAGWATYAPAGQHRFARSLAIVFLVSVILMLAISVLDIAPRQRKGMTDSEWYPRFAAFVLIPPIVAAAGLTVVRMRVATAG